MPVSQTTSHSCAECKRLKLKCDRDVPCSSCVRRGCSQICPDGTLTPGKGSRFILNNTKELHEEIAALRTRVKQLEGALAELQAQITPEPHPLLQKSLDMMSTTFGSVDSQSIAANPEAENESLIDTFGRLNLEPDGQTVWYGPNAGTYFYIPHEKSEESTIHPLPVDLMILSRMAPLRATTMSEAEDILRQDIKKYLPPEEEATELFYSHHSLINWTSEDGPSEWPEFRDKTLKPVYSLESEPTDCQLAMFFLHLAVSLILDPKRPPNYVEADKYHRLSKICISLGRDIFESSTLDVIRYLQFLAFYYGFTDDANGHNRAWITGTLAVHLAQMGGLHRENPQWNLDPETIEGRRRTWWELVSFDTIRSLELGRPRAINVDQFDTKMPHDPEDDGQKPTFNRIRFRFMTTALGRVLDEAFRVKPPSYARTLQLDKEIRDWPLQEPPTVEISIPRPEEVSRKLLALLMRSLATNGIREIALVYLHRRYFIEALTRYPEEPLRSKYAMSVIAVYRSSVLLLQGFRKVESLAGKQLPRVFTMGQHGLSVYVCLCAIVIKSPGCSLSKSCLEEIDGGKDLFLRIASSGVPYARSLVTTLHAQAHHSMELYRKGEWSSTQTTTSDQDVMAFAGRPGLLSRKKQIKNDLLTDPTSTPDSNTSDASTPGLAHPLLMEYLMRVQNAQGTEAEYKPSVTSHDTSPFGFTSEQDIFSPFIADPQFVVGQQWTEGLSLGDPSLSTGIQMEGFGVPNPTSGSVDGLTAYPTQSYPVFSATHVGPPGGSGNTLPHASTGFPHPTPLSSVAQQPPQDEFWRMFLNDLDMIPSGEGEDT